VSDFVRHVQALKPGRPDRIIVAGCVIGWSAAPDAQYGIIQVTDDRNMLPG
jgi:hypothetical protein